jgi:ankyrin repeat protein
MINLNDKQQKNEIRLFVSSTFEDLKKERDHLVNVVFPKLRKLCAERGIEFTEIDLRWGVTAKQAKQGKVIPICLQQIKRCHPYFIGILGHRYGWKPGQEELLKQENLAMEYPWLKSDIQDGKSITEIEIQYGVLRNTKEDNIAFFYFRNGSPATFCEKKGSPRNIKLEKLKAAIGESKYSSKIFKTNAQLGHLVLRDFKTYLDEYFPEKELTLSEREQIAHASFAMSRVNLYISSKDYFKVIDDHISNISKPLVITGDSGSGKSALLSNWLKHFQKKYPYEFVFYHFVGGGGPDSSTHYNVMRRIMSELKVYFDLDIEIPLSGEKLERVLPLFFGSIPHEQRCVIVIDALNQLEDKANAHWLGWLPKKIPDNIRIIVSTLPGDTFDELCKREYRQLQVKKLNNNEKKKLIVDYLNLFGKELSQTDIKRITGYSESDSPLILRTILDELRIFGVHERLQERIGYYLKSSSKNDLFYKVLVRFETVYGKDLVKEVLSLIWSSRSGLSEKELLEITKTPALKWAPFIYAIENHMVSRSGRLDFFHDHFRKAVEIRYLKSENDKKMLRTKLVKYFGKDRLSNRAIDELPYQLKKANEIGKLGNYVIDIKVFLRLYHKGGDPEKIELQNIFHSVAKEGSLNEAIYKKFSENMSFLDQMKSDGVTEEYNALLNVIVEGYFAMGRFAMALADIPLAENLFSKVLKLVKENYADEPFVIAEILHQLGIVQMIKKSEEAHWLFESAIRIYKKYPEKQIEFAECLGDFGALFINRKNPTSAKPLLKHSLEIKQKYLGMESDKTLTTALNLAITYGVHDGDKAEKIFKDVLEIYERKLGPKHPKVGDCYSGLGNHYFDVTRFDEAETMFHKALKIYENALGEEHSNYAADVRNSLERLNVCLEADEKRNRSAHDKLNAEELGETLLIAMRRNQNRECIYLLNRGADVNYKGKNNGYTALMIGSDYENREMVKHLLFVGADANIKCDDGRTALMIASAKNNIEIISLLLSHGADVNAINEGYGTSALMMAAEIGGLETIQFLVKNDADVNQKSRSSGDTALTYAAAFNHTDIVDFLIKAGADNNAADKADVSSLMISANNENEKMVRILLDSGVNVKAKDKNGWSAFDYAEFKKNKKIMKMLKSVEKSKYKRLINRIF